MKAVDEFSFDLLRNREKDGCSGASSLGCWNRVWSHVKEAIFMPIGNWDGFVWDGDRGQHKGCIAGKQNEHVVGIHEATDRSDGS